MCVGQQKRSKRRGCADWVAGSFCWLVMRQVMGLVDGEGVDELGKSKGPRMQEKTMTNLEAGVNLLGAAVAGGSGAG